MNLAQLETFLAVARTESFTKAGSAVGRSQSAVSRQIQDLETSLGVRLFDRLGGKVSLTAAGRMLLEEAPKVLQQAQNIRERIGDFNEEIVGELRVGATITAASTFLPHLLAHFRRRNPKVRISLTPAHSDRLLNELRGNELDVAVIGRRVDQHDIKTCFSIPDEIVLVAPTDHPLAGGGPVRPQELAGRDFMFREPGSDSRRVVKQWLRERNIEVSTLLELW